MESAAHSASLRGCAKGQILVKTEYSMMAQTMNAISTDPVVMKRLAKYLAQQCFRNTFLEDLHTPGTVKPVQVSLAKPVAYQFQLIGHGHRPGRFKQLRTSRSDDV
jgi:hypothetical protein